MRIPSSEITPEALYLSRRMFLAGLGLAASSAVLAGACSPPPPPAATPTPDATPPRAQVAFDEMGDPLTEYQRVTTFNNYFEFTQDKVGIDRLARGLRTAPWAVTVGGLVNKPLTLDIDDLRKRFPSKERVYRLRCVEAWSMVIPWLGFPLAGLLALAEPTSAARYVRFESLLDAAQMPGQNNRSYKWPYVEGLRLDEAMNPLAILATGLYGKTLAPQNGAPLRLVAPWKYGLKGLKAVVKIELVAEMPVSFWMLASPREYGFYANVNPQVSHPRWSQATELRLGETERRPTLLFNGYGDQVAALYAGMDLRQEF